MSFIRRFRCNYVSSYPTVHGFLQSEYSVTEDDRLDTVFQVNVKGTTQFSTLAMTGTITAQAAGTASNGYFVLLILHTTSSFVIGDSDFVGMEPITLFNNSADIRLFTTNDEITLETDDRVQLIFTPTNALIIGGLESAGEYVRDSAIVNIIDTDCKKYCITLTTYLITISIVGQYWR